MAAATNDPRFLSEVGEMVEACGEILVEICFSHSAGRRDILLCHSLLSFQERIATLPPRTMVNVYRRYDLPLRAVIDEAMIQASLTMLGGTEYLIVYLHPRDDWRRAEEYDQGDGWLSCFQHNEGAEELEEDLRDTLGEQAAVGPYPEWGEGYDNVLWAIVQNTDGSVQVGIY